MSIEKQIKALKIDLSPIGIQQCHNNETYYCTPENADIFGWAGVDGIHYCTIPQFGEMIFAVSPMNFGDCVHPIARSFEDLLRLLLSCVDMAALEQCYAWEEEQFKAFLADCPATKEQQAVLERIAVQFGLSPMENAFGYVKTLQAAFDLSLIPYTDDYYDSDMNAAAPQRSKPWEVYFGGGYFGKSERFGGKAGREVAVNRSFPWGEEIWHIPSVYVCAKGMVVDFCVEIAPERMKAFMAQWDFEKNEERHLTDEIRNRIAEENPLDISFRPHLMVNGRKLPKENGSGISWLPAGCIPYGERNACEAARVISYYRLDETRAWCFQRVSFGWTSAKKPTIKKMELRLERHPAQIEGVHFKNPAVGDVILFENPVTKEKYALTVCAYEKQTMTFPAEHLKRYQVPTHFTEMEYVVSPEIVSDNFSVTDCRQNDAMKRTEEEKSAGGFAIIGGADGPTALLLAAPQGKKHRVACSALTFEPQNEVEWKITFREKRMDDIEIELNFLEERTKTPGIP